MLSSSSIYVHEERNGKTEQQRHFICRKIFDTTVQAPRLSKKAEYNIMKTNVMAILNLDSLNFPNGMERSTAPI